MTPAVILDTETTSSDPEKAEVIQLAYKIPGSAPASKKSFSHRGPMEWGALAVHHIIQGETERPLFSRESLPSDISYWIGHNIDFDWKVCGMPPVLRICTLAMARNLWPKLDSHKLGALIYYLLGATHATRELLQSAHDAAADIALCEIVYNAACEEAGLDPTDYPAVYAFSEDARVPRVWTFGKFSGQPISAADRGYANWYRKLPDPDPYVLEALRRAGLI